MRSKRSRKTWTKPHTRRTLRTRSRLHPHLRGSGSTKRRESCSDLVLIKSSTYSKSSNLPDDRTVSSRGKYFADHHLHTEIRIRFSRRRYTLCILSLTEPTPGLCGRHNGAMKSFLSDPVRAYALGVQLRAAARRGPVARRGPSPKRSSSASTRASQKSRLLCCFTTWLFQVTKIRRAGRAPRQRDACLVPG